MNDRSAFQKRFTFSVLLFGFAVLLAIIYCLVHYANRGFELSDETFYLLHTNYFNPESYNTSDFGLLNNVACFGNATLLNMRIAKLAYQLLAVFIFTWSLLKYLDFKNILLNSHQKLFVFIIITVTSFGHYDYLPMTLSYNSWSLILMLFFLAAVLFEFTIASFKISIFTSIFVGFLCFAMFISKAPNGIIAMGLYGLFNLFYIKKNTLLKVAGFFIGAFLSFLLILKNSHNFFALIENYRITIFEVKHTESGTYFKQIFKMFEWMGHHKLISFICLAGLLVAAFVGKKILSELKKNTSSKKDLYSYSILFIGLLLCVPFYKGNGHKTFNDFIAVTFLVLNPFLFVYLYRSNSVKISRFFKSDLNMIILVLILTPVLLMLGTNNAFYYSVSPTMVFAFAGVLVYLVSSNINYDKYLPLFSCIICLFIFSIFYHGAVKKPYKQDNLNNKIYPLSFNPLLKGIYESKAAFIDYTSVNCIMNHLNKKNAPFLTFFNFYGFTVINNNRIITDQPLSTQERNMELMNYVLSKVDITQSKPLLLLADTVIGNKNYQDLFHKHKIDLGYNYKLAYEYKFLSSKEKICFYRSN